MYTLKHEHTPLYWVKCPLYLSQMLLVAISKLLV